MKRYLFVISILLHLLCAAVSANAANRQDEHLSFVYDVDFDFRFDNREYYKSSFSESMTIFGARLTPSIGVEMGNPWRNMKHKLMLGIDIMKDFGNSPVSSSLAGSDADEGSIRQVNGDLFREITMFYNMEGRVGKTDISLYAGIFPRKMTGGNYSDVFFSDSLKFYDNNLEGILFKLERPRFRFEVGCDWFGKKADIRKEKFMIFSAGQGWITPELSLGYAGYMYHFAGSYSAEGVVDNILLNPYANLDLSRRTRLQTLSFKLGYVQALQHDRVFVGHYVLPSGGEFDFNVSNWNVGIHNRLFYGNDMMPYYNSSDTGGNKYGTRLYLGDPFYRIHDDGAAGPGFYDRLSIWYEPYIARWLSIRIEARFHFHDFRYSGCQQLVTLNFNINR